MLSVQTSGRTGIIRSSHMHRERETVQRHRLESKVVKIKTRPHIPNKAKQKRELATQDRAHIRGRPL